MCNNKAVLTGYPVVELFLVDADDDVDLDDIVVIDGVDEDCWEVVDVDIDGVGLDCVELDKGEEEFDDVVVGG